METFSQAILASKIGGYILSKNFAGILIIMATIIVIGGIFLLGRSNNSTSSNQATQPDNHQSSGQTTESQNDKLTREEVATHKTAEDCWTIIDGSVYNLTSYIPNHPGGSEILRACGIDASTLFDQRHTADGQAVGSGTPHSSNAQSALQSFKLGPLQQ